AKDTGGRAVFNTNDLKPGLAGALKETSFYYLLAWKPERQVNPNSRFHHIEVSIPSRSDLIVRVRGGVFFMGTELNQGRKKEEKTQPDNSAVDKQIQEALAAPYPDRHLPISLTLNYLQTPDKGLRLSASMQVPAEFLTFAPENGQHQAVLTVMGAFFDERGQRGETFSGKINVTALAPEVAKRYKRDLSYTYPVTVPAGLYQVRVAAKDEKSGVVGSAHDWVQIPDLTNGKLAMSSLLLGERTDTGIAPVSTNTATPNETVGLSVNHRFKSNSYLRFLVFAYNAIRATNDGMPDVAI